VRVTKPSWERTLRRLSPDDTRCDALASSGHRCRRRPVRATYYHGDNEIYGFDGITKAGAR